MSSSHAELLDGLPGPGACLTVATADSVDTYTVGYRQVFDDEGPLPTPMPMTPSTAHDLGSVTKVVATTAALLTLVDDGAVDLADPASRFASHLVDSSLADLLQHRSGLWEWWPTYLTAADPDSALDVVASLSLRYPPGSGRHYSDLGFMTLGRVVELVAGQPLPAAASSLVFSRLGLGGVRYGDTEPDVPVAAGARGDAVERHMLDTGEPYPVAGTPAEFAGWRSRVRAGEVDDGNAYHAFGGVAGHAGLFGTAADLVTFGRHVLAALRGEGRWRASTVRTFLTPGADPAQALGFRVWTSTVEGHSATAFGHTGFPGVAFAVLPSLDAVVVLLTNRLHVTTPPPPEPYEPGWLRILDAVHGELVERRSA